MMESGRRSIISSFGSSCDIYGFPYPIGASELKRNQFNSVREVFLIAGASFIIKSDFWAAPGGFDSEYFVHMEELDLCWRA